MKQGPAVVLIVALTSGCDFVDEWSTDPAIRMCETAIQETLQAPATYKRTEAVISGERVLVRFDAQNGFGAILRKVGTCLFAGEGYDASGKSPDPNARLVLRSMIIDEYRLSNAQLDPIKEAIAAQQGWIPQAKTAVKAN